MYDLYPVTKGLKLSRPDHTLAQKRNQTLRKEQDNTFLVQIIPALRY